MNSDSLLDIYDVCDVYASAGRVVGWSPTAVSGLEMSADGKKLYVICWDLHLMYTYNIADAAWSPDFLDVGGFNPSDIVSSPDKRYIYTINHKSDSVSDQS